MTPTTGNSATVNGIYTGVTSTDNVASSLSGKSASGGTTTTNILANGGIFYDIYTLVGTTFEPGATPSGTSFDAVTSPIDVNQGRTDAGRPATGQLIAYVKQ